MKQSTSTNTHLTYSYIPSLPRRKIKGPSIPEIKNSRPEACRYRIKSVWGSSSSQEPKLRAEKNSRAEVLWKDYDHTHTLTHTHTCTPHIHKSKQKTWAKNYRLYRMPMSKYPKSYPDDTKSIPATAMVLML